MKKASLALIMGTTLILSGCGSDNKAEEKAESKTYTTEVEQYSYSLGARMGKFASDQLAAQDELGLESDKAALIDGFNQAINDKSQFSDEEVESFVQAFAAKFQAAQKAQEVVLASENIEKGIAFLAENGVREGVTTTESGLQYEVLVAADGAKPTAQDTVRVHYHGTLIDGTVFDSSVSRGQPAQFVLNQVIPGWTEGVQMMAVGSKYRLFIPSELAYGTRATGQISPNSTLIFDVELLGIAPFTE